MYYGMIFPTVFWRVQRRHKGCYSQERHKSLIDKNDWHNLYKNSFGTEKNVISGFKIHFKGGDSYERFINTRTDVRKIQN